MAGIIDSSVDNIKERNGVKEEKEYTDKEKGTSFDKQLARWQQIAAIAQSLGGGSSPQMVSVNGSAGSAQPVATFNR